MWRSRGVSILEILIVVGIVAVITAISTTVFSNFLDNQRLNAAVEGTVSIIQRARSYTLASKGNSFYSIHVEDKNSQNPTGKNFIELFKANDYWNISPINKRFEKFSMPNGVEIVNVIGFQTSKTAISAPTPTPITGYDITYRRLTGDVVLVDPTNLTNGTTTPPTSCSPKIIIKSTKSTKAKKISLFTTGIVQTEDSEYTCQTFFPGEPLAGSPDINYTDDVNMRSNWSGTWKPTTPYTSGVISGAPVAELGFGWAVGPQYRIIMGFLRFDTSGLPDCADIQSAILNLYIKSRTVVGGHTFAAEYYPSSNWPIDLTDWPSGLPINWPPPPLGNAISNVQVADLAIETYNSFGLQDYINNISYTGFTGFRFFFSDQTAPVGDEKVQWVSNDNPTPSENYNRRPKLEICYY
jgi:type II secretory pathway pseudopilin PulG